MEEYNSKSPKGSAIYALLLAGGTGSRYGSSLPKQFLKLGEESLVQRSVRRFREWGYLKSLVVVSHLDTISRLEKELDGLLEEGDRIVEGGETRHDSTLNGIQALQEMGVGLGDHVFIHDVARPFFLYRELDELLRVSREIGSSTLAVLNSDTLVREGDRGTVGNIVDREKIYLVKTPQMASWERIKNLIQSECNPSPTDLCSWDKMFGYKTGIVPTKDWNLKITNPGDLEFAKSILAGLQTTYPDFQ